VRQLIIKQLDYDRTPVAGLALVGHYLKALQPVWGRLDAALSVKGGVANSDVLRSYLGLLTQGRGTPASATAQKPTHTQRLHYGRPSSTQTTEIKGARMAQTRAILGLMCFTGTPHAVKYSYRFALDYGFRHWR
jgi:hypothetical protein